MMPSGRWLRVKELFAAALEQTPSQRATFLQEQCAGDSELRNEVAVLLDSHAQLGAFLADPREIGPYQLAGVLGAGGMGQVYRARDERLGRDVAIKVLHPGPHAEAQLRRFEQEARLAGSINHPNILTVYDVGVHDGAPYMVSELLEGRTLREALADGPLPAAQVIEVARQLARGLAAAHAKGIVHRDLKPENVFLTSDGRVKILDFGIAKLAPEESAVHTDAGAVFGTAGYMSPEQVRGEPLDARSDLFSFGAILYEMISGRAPFKRATRDESNAAILHDQPPPLPALDAVARRCLQKDRAERFASAEQLLAALDRPPRQPRRGLLAAAAVALALAAVALLFARRSHPPRAASIVVLPFVNLSADKDNEYFSDGITEEIINGLANVEGVHVVARTSAFSFKGKNENVRDIAAQLNVATVLEGSVRREGNQLRVTAQLIDAADGYHLWSKTYDREAKGVFALEDELSRAIVQALQPNLIPAPPRPQPTTSLAAHDLYLRGRFLMNHRSRETLAQAAQLFEQAIAQDPDYALAWSGLSDATFLSVSYRYEHAADALPKAREAALKAVALDASLAEAHTSLGTVHYSDYDWAAAEREFRRACELRPGYAYAHYRYATVLSNTGRVEDGIREARLALSLDPGSVPINHSVGANLFLARRFEEAIAAEQRTLQLDPRANYVRDWVSAAYMLLGRFPEAFQSLDEHQPPDDEATEVVRAWVLARSGDVASARRKLERIDAPRSELGVSRAIFGGAWMAAGDFDKAFFWLNRAADERDAAIFHVKVMPLWDPLRGDPRFHLLLRRMNLE